MNNAVASGSYADMKLVKTRSVCQIVVEIPIEQASRFIEMFGVPVPGAEIPVAIARLNDGAVTSETEEHLTPSAVAKGSDTPRRPFHELPPSQQAAIRCNDRDFQSFFAVENAEEAANAVRLWCGVASRSDLNTDEFSTRKWQALDQQYRDWRFEHHLPERRG